MVTFDPRAGKWLALALTASFGVNIFLAGLFIGHQMLRPPPQLFVHGERPGDRPMPAFFDRIAGTLSPDNRAVFLTTLDKHRAEIANAGAALRQARLKVRELITAERFDRPATEAAMSDLRNRNVEFQRAIQMALLDTAEALPSEARRQMLHPDRPPER